MAQEQIQIVRRSPTATLWRWKCSCGTASGRWYASEAEAVKAAQRHQGRHPSLAGGGSAVAFRLGAHRLDAPCAVCAVVTREGVAIDFPTRARGAAAIARLYGNELDADDEARLKPLPVTIDFACHAACVDSLWPIIGELPPRRE